MKLGDCNPNDVVSCDSLRLRQLLQENRFTDAIKLSKSIFEKVGTKGSCSAKIESTLVTASQYNHAMCLQHGGFLADAVAHLKCIQSQIGENRIMKECRKNKNLCLFGVIDLDEEPDCNVLQLQFCHLFIKMGDISSAFKQFQNTGNRFGDHCEFLDVILHLAILIIQLNAFSKKITSFQVQEIVQKIFFASKPKVAIQLENWLLLAKLLDETKWTKSEETIQTQFYGFLSTLMAFIKWMVPIPNDDMLQDPIKKFGMTAFTAFKTDPKEGGRKLLQIIRNIRIRIFGIDDDISVEINSLVGNESVGGSISPSMTEITWKGGDSFKFHFVPLSDATHLVKITLKGQSWETPSLIFRNDLTNFLEGCENLNKLYLWNIVLIGGNKKKVHLPNISQFIYNNNDKLYVNIKTVNDIQNYKFFYKQKNDCLWKDISTIDLFCLGDSVKAERDTKSLQLFGLEIKKGIALNYFEHVFIHRCKFLKTKKCECDYCVENCPSFKPVHFPNIKQLYINDATINFDLRLFNHMKHFSLCNDNTQGIVVDIGHIRYIPNVYLRNVNVRCVMEREKSEINVHEGWKLFNVNFIDSVGKILKHYK